MPDNSACWLANPLLNVTLVGQPTMRDRKGSLEGMDKESVL